MINNEFEFVLDKNEINEYGNSLKMRIRCNCDNKEVFDELHERINEVVVDILTKQGIYVII